MSESLCKHIPFAEGNIVTLANDDDSYYTQHFSSWGEIEEFISELRREAFKAFGSYPDTNFIDTTGEVGLPFKVEPRDWVKVFGERILYNDTGNPFINLSTPCNCGEKNDV